MKKRVGLLVLIATVCMTAGSAFAAPGGTRCDSWQRRWQDPSTGQYHYTNHNTADPTDRTVGGPENIVVKAGDGDGHGDSRYGVNANDFWIEALGGGGYGSNGYPYPSPQTGEGGVVQGDIHPANAADANFSVWSFSLDDEGDRNSWHDSIQGACVSVNGTKVSTGDIVLPTHLVPHA